MRQKKIKEDVDLVNPFLTIKDGIVVDDFGFPIVGEERDIAESNAFRLMDAWREWVSYKKRDHKKSYKSTETENIALRHLRNLSNGDVKKAIHLIYRAISNGWAGIYDDPDYYKNINANGTSANFGNSGKNKYSRPGRSITFD